jgi:hypothetical protein
VVKRVEPCELRDVNFRRLTYHPLTLIYRPIPATLVPDLQQPVFRIVPLLTVGTLQVSAPGGSLTIVIFGDGEGSPAAAGNQEHLYRLGISLGHLFISGVYNLAPSG